MNYVKFTDCTLEDSVGSYIDLKDDGFLVINKEAREAVGLIPSFEEVREIQDKFTPFSTCITPGNYRVMDLVEKGMVPVYIFQEQMTVYPGINGDVLDFGGKFIINLSNGKTYETD